MTDVNKDLGKRIRMLRKAARLTQFELAELAEINENFMGKIERGQSGVSLHTLQRLAGALNVPVRKLIEGPPESAKGATSSEAHLQRILLFLRKKNTQELKIIWKILKQMELLSKTNFR
jgi:transcriptional regulator with XRE-family HTH domain